jgi:hypothetical protein
MVCLSSDLSAYTWLRRMERLGGGRDAQASFDDFMECAELSERHR